jgi:hypothetical protein
MEDEDGSGCAAVKATGPGCAAVKATGPGCAAVKTTGPGCAAVKATGPGCAVKASVPGLAACDYKTNKGLTRLLELSLP